MLIMFLRAGFLYIFIIAVMRCIGKRQISQMQPYELVFTILIADLASTPMSSASIPLLHGVLTIAALVLVQSIFTLLVMKSHRIREVISGKPSVLVHNGVVDEKELKKQAIPLSELLEETRIAGIASLSDVGCAILEVSGDMTFFPVSQKRPVTTMDMQIVTEYENMTLALVMDGRIQQNNLARGGRTQEWLRQQLKRFSLGEKEVFLCLLDTRGNMTIQAKGSQSIRTKNVMSPQEVCW